MIGLKLVINLLTILIESKWNLKLTYETFSLIDILHINRIKVEFKEEKIKYLEINQEGY